MGDSEIEPGFRELAEKLGKYSDFVGRLLHSAKRAKGSFVPEKVNLSK